MTDREKLIELLDKTFAEQYDKRGLLTAVHPADDLLDNGVIVPPCKVGDKVYRIKYNHQLQKDIIISFKVTEILYSSNRGVRPFIFVTDTGYRFDNCDIYPNEEIYLSKKEAKKALAEKAVKE